MHLPIQLACAYEQRARKRVRKRCENALQLEIRHAARGMRCAAHTFELAQATLPASRSCACAYETNCVGILARVYTLRATGQRVRAYPCLYAPCLRQDSSVFCACIMLCAHACEHMPAA
eukprot:6173957-Pleurochrysis_carterae.AAC.1